MNSNFPNRLLQIKNCPKKLYVVGNEKILKNFCIAIVGSRKCTNYGLEIASKIAKDLSNIGITIVSGLAIGIDSISHINSMKLKGKTIAVLGAGLKNIYPKENVNLFNEILLSGGCIITEYNMETPISPKNFPIRNRLISGISVGTLIIEATKKSGSMITARNTIKQNKKLFCVPNSVNIKQSEGTNELIKKGAILTRNYIDILDEFLPNMYKEKINNNKSMYTKNIPKKYKNIYELIGNVPININELYRKLPNKDISYLNQILYMMILEDYIKELPGNNYIKNSNNYN